MQLANRALGDYLQLLQKHHLVTKYRIFPGDMGRPVRRVSCNSQEETAEALFFCKGAHFKEEYLFSAVSAGAFCYVSEREYGIEGISFLIVSDVRRAMALLGDFYYGQVWKNFRLIGITGTKGKSTTTYFVKYILDEYLRDRGKPESAVLSSIDTYDGVQRFESHLTTPEALDLQRHFYNAAQSGVEYLEMEVSSQGLKYDRVYGVSFDVGCYLNLGADHISPLEHPDAEDYFQSKLKLFSQCAVACVNRGGARADEVIAVAEAHCRRVITFGITEDAEVFGSQIRKSGNDILFHVRTARFSRQFRLTMPGLFNVENALAAIAICEALGIPERFVYAGLMKARVPGRMEVYANANNRIVAIVDYAHNRLSFEKLFASVREEYPGRQIFTVFGCPGKKALDRRRDLGEIAGRFSKKVILTEEDPGEEPVEDICQAIAQYVAAEGCDYSILPNRGEAILNAVLECEEDSVLLITGKGEETRQKRGVEYVPCPSDVEYLKDALHQYDVLHHLDEMEKVRSLMDLLPALTRCSGKTFVVKYGGSALGQELRGDTILADAAALRMAGVRIVLVHGGGKAITGWLSRLGIPSRFQDGYRVTDAETMTVAEMTLSGQVNKAIVSALEQMGVSAAGISGRDGALLKAEPKTVSGGSLGQVGSISGVNTAILETLLKAGFLPVVSPVACGPAGEALNVNADDAACAIAEALQADKLLFLTDTDGILVDARNRQTRIARLDLIRAAELVSSGFVAGGMLPKLRSCIHAVEHQVGKVVILDGKSEHGLLLESVSRNSIGTAITKK